MFFFFTIRNFKLTNTHRWDYLEIQTSKIADSEAQAYAAGLLEGWVTANLIHLYWINTLKNYCNDRNDTCARLNDYVRKNKEWILSEVDKKNGSDSYWYQVSNHCSGAFEFFPVHNKRILLCRAILHEFFFFYKYKS